MKKIFSLALMVSLLCMPAATFAQPDRTANAPPVSQPLVREGDFAIRLVEGLRMGTAKDEAEAESMLASYGIAPRNGWIADYPMTPDIIGELEGAAAEAADSERLPMAREEAVRTLQRVAFDAGLPISVETPDQYAEAPGEYDAVPPPAAPEYIEPGVVNNYYYSEGPPVVTYYPPPWDYTYMYAWVPSPFYFSGFFFPGFYILHDFHKVVIINRRPCVVTNHFFDRDHRRFFVIDHLRRGSGRGFVTPSDRYLGRRFNSFDGRRGAASIFERSRERAGTERGRIERGPVSPRYNQGFRQGGSPPVRGRDSRLGPSFERGAARPSPRAESFSSLRSDRVFREGGSPQIRGRDSRPSASFDRGPARPSPRAESFTSPSSERGFRNERTPSFRGQEGASTPGRFNSPTPSRNFREERAPAFRGRDSGFSRSLERGPAAFNRMREPSGRGFGAAPSRGSAEREGRSSGAFQRGGSLGRDGSRRG